MSEEAGPPDACPGDGDEGNVSDNFVDPSLLAGGGNVCIGTAGTGVTGAGTADPWIAADGKACFGRDSPATVGATSNGAGTADESTAGAGVSGAGTADDTTCGTRTEAMEAAVIDTVGGKTVAAAVAGPGIDCDGTAWADTVVTGSVPADVPGSGVAEAAAVASGTGPCTSDAVIADAFVSEIAEAAVLSSSAVACTSEAGVVANRTVGAGTADAGTAGDGAVRTCDDVASVGTSGREIAADV